jgi:hypothetical protein
MQHPEKLILVGGLSRSGTTLLSAALDAHSRISAGAELIPTAVPDLKQLRAVLLDALSKNDDFSFTGRHIRQNFERGQGSFVTRCYRAGASANDVVAAIDAMLSAGKLTAIDFPDRFALAVQVIEQRRINEGTEYGSFKINTPSLVPVLGRYPQAYIVCLVRHPAAVVMSHINNDFGKTTEQVCGAWLNYLKSFYRARNAFGDRVIIIRYEDLISNPRAALTGVFRALPLEMDERMLRYNEVDTKILQSRHPNTDQLRRGFLPPSGDSRPIKVEPSVSGVVERYCGSEMEEWGYQP